MAGNATMRRVRRGHAGLFTHLFARFGLLLVVPTLALGLFLANRLAEARREMADRQLVLEAQALASRVDAFVDGKVRAVESLAGQLEHAGWPLDPADTQWALTNFRQRTDHITIIYVATAEGRSLYADPIHLPDGTPTTPREYSDRDYYRDLVRTQSTAISNAQLGKMTKVPNVHLAVPLKAPDGTLRGYVSASLNLTALQALAESITTVGPASKLVVADRSGRALAHPDAKARREMRSLADVPLFGPGIALRTARDDEGVESRAARFSIDGRGLGWTAAASMPLLQFEQDAALARWQAVGAAALTLLLGLVLCALIAARLARPIHELADATQKLGRGYYELGLHSRAGDPQEVTQLIDSLVAMAAQRQRLEQQAAERTQQLDTANGELKNSLKKLHEVQERAAVADRLATVGVLAAGVAHEINNPLAYVKSNVDYVLERLGDAGAGVPGTSEMRAALTDAAQGALRVQKIVRDLKVFARDGEADDDVAFALEPMIESAIAITNVELRQKAKLVRQFGKAPNVKGSESKLAQVVLNLLVNAVQALPPGRPETNEIRVTTREESGAAIIEVEDTGSGIPTEHLSRLFDPFFTTKPVGEGTGLGLCISRRIVTSMNGELSVRSKLGQGTTFQIRLPGTGETISPAAPRVTLPREAAPARRGRVLVIDDEASIGTAISRLLSAHEVVWLGTGDEALERLRTDQNFDVILCDVAMPKRSGIECYQMLEKECPKLAERVVFLSGGAFEPKAQAFLASTTHVWVKKPFDGPQLKVLVNERIAAGSAAV